MRTAGPLDKLLLMIGRRRAVRVSGASMSPTLESGDVVLVKPGAALSAGDVVVTEHPFKRSVTIVKRISAIDGSRVSLLGDNPSESSDSRTFGSLPLERIRGKVVSVIRRGG